MFRKVFPLLFTLSLIITCSSQEAVIEQDSHSAFTDIAALDLFVTSSEYKLLLSPDKFANIEQGFKDYWDIIQKVAEQENIPVLISENPLKEKRAAVSFLDTETLDLRKNRYLLRHKRKYKGDILPEKVEYTIKYRNRTAEEARSVDLTMSDKYYSKFDEIELETDIVYYSLLNGELDITYSVGNAFDADGSVIFTLGDVMDVFPSLINLDLNPDIPLVNVAGVIVDERMVQMGHLDFGKGLLGRMDMSVWIIVPEAGDTVLISEFSFDHDFFRDKNFDPDAMAQCRSFIDKLYEAKPDWVVPGALKAAFVFDNHK